MTNNGIITRKADNYRIFLNFFENFYCIIIETVIKYRLELHNRADISALTEIYI